MHKTNQELMDGLLLRVGLNAPSPAKSKEYINELMDLARQDERERVLNELNNPQDLGNPFKNINLI